MRRLHVTGSIVNLPDPVLQVGSQTEIILCECDTDSRRRPGCNRGISESPIQSTRATGYRCSIVGAPELALILASGLLLGRILNSMVCALKAETDAWQVRLQSDRL